MRDVTQMLIDWGNGDPEALERLMPLVYDELHGLAESYMRRERPGHTLQPTALVNEAYLQLVDQKRIQWQNRGHFFGVAAQLMRRITMLHVRHLRAAKRGGGERPLPFDETVQVSEQRGDALIALDDALEGLTNIDGNLARVVELRFFGGLTVEESADVLGVSPTTIKREWRAARAWLLDQLRDDPAAGDG